MSSPAKSNQRSPIAPFPRVAMERNERENLTSTLANQQKKGRLGAVRFEKVVFFATSPPVSQAGAAYIENENWTLIVVFNELNILVRRPIYRRRS